MTESGEEFDMAYWPKKSPRVLLFVQTGDGRPKCIGRWGGDWGPLLAQAVTDGGLVPNHDCDRWWLVECENAHQGRTLIEMHETRHSPVITWTGKPPAGRILASGGKCPHANVIPSATPGTFWLCRDCGQTFYLHPTDKTQHGILASGGKA